MYAIVEIAGKQYKVRENDKLIVPRLSGEVDDSVRFDRVLLYADDGETFQLGTPVIPDASVTARIVEHVKGDKVLVFRKKRRKRFKVKRGHRQPYTRIEVSGFSLDGEAESEAETASDVPAETPHEAPAVAESDVAEETAAAEMSPSSASPSSSSPPPEAPASEPSDSASEKTEPEAGADDADEDKADS